LLIRPRIISPIKGQPADKPCPSIKDEAAGTLEQFPCKAEGIQKMKRIHQN
jgi:hypothetical protein